MHISFLHRRPAALTWMGVVKFTILCVPVVLLGILLNDHVFFSETLRFTYRPGHRGHVVVPKNASQVLKSADPDLQWRLGTDVLPFTVTLPRLIEAVSVRVRVHPGTQSYVTLDSVGKKGAGTSTIVQAAALDSLDWKHVSSGNLTLWMRNSRPIETQVTEGTGKNEKKRTVTTEQPVRQYPSVEAFSDDPAQLESVGVVGIDPMVLANVNTYSPRTTVTRLGHTLRGSHQFYVYASNEVLSFSFEKIDLNRSVGTDGVTVRIARVDQLKTSGRTWLKTISVGDDGISGKVGPRGKAQPVKLELPNVQPGVYFVDISTSDDVVLANFESMQHDLSFAGRVVLSEGPAYAEPTFTPVVMTTNSSTLTLAANHEQGKQEVQVGGQKVNIQDVKIDHTVKQLRGASTLTIPKGDIILTGDGLLAFQGFDLLPSGARVVNLAAGNPDLSGFDYILADYLPQAVGDRVIEQTYRIEDLALNGKTVSFSLNAPGLVSTGATLGLKDIRVTLIRGDFPWDKVWNKLRRS